MAEKQQLENLKRQEFIAILFDLANMSPTQSTKDQRANMYLRLESLYYIEGSEKTYRHYYSDIFMVITQIKDGDKPGDLEKLGLNLQRIREGYYPKNKDSTGKIIDISTCLRKLYDHVSLDCARIAYSEACDWKYSGESFVGELSADLVEFKKNFEKQIKESNDNVKSLEEQYNKSKDELDKSQKKIDELSSEVEKTQNKYITVLGVFSSIVLALTGGIAFSTSIFENMHKASIYRTAFVVLLIGFVLVNIFYFLIAYLEKVLEQKWKLGFGIYITVDIVIIASIILTLMGWKFAWVENRNEDVKEDLNNRTSAVTEAQTESTTQALETLLETTGLAVPKN